jgi:hypothetical protein
LATYQKAYSDWVLGQGPKPKALVSEPVLGTTSVGKNFVSRRREIIEDVLRDALFYGRDILNRNR